DGGGKVTAFRNPIVGLDRVLRLYAGLRRKPVASAAVLIRPAWIDGLPGFVSREQDAVLQTTALDVEGGRIVGIYVTRNPEKLRGIEVTQERQARP
ncbi:hypothetical protein, partial [Klebsiella pneumoniae]|uniref:hypothetical protein n=1 Tax=Klebsiella pneumoniae TaxID=573 RepID=UPI0038523504